MPNHSAVTVPVSEPRPQRRFEPRLIVLLVMWLAATCALSAMLFLGVRGTDRYAVPRVLLHVAYVAALLWHLAKSGPPIGRLPEWPRGLLDRWPYVGAAVVLAILLLFGLMDGGLALLLLLLAASSVVLLIVWRRSITVRSAALGLAASAVALVAGGIAFWRHGFVAKPMLVFMLVFIPPMFVAGGLLVARTGLGAVRVIEGRYGAAARSFLWGCLLFVPLGLTNAAVTSPNPKLSWVGRWWHPLSLPLWSGIVEEVVFRTLLVSACYAMLRPAFRRSPASAVVGAVLFSAVTFGLGHGRTVGQLVSTGLGYGLPMAVIFARRDWEHAVGAHYMTNMVNWVMALLRV